MSTRTDLPSSESSPATPPITSAPHTKASVRARSRHRLRNRLYPCRARDMGFGGGRRSLCFLGSRVVLSAYRAFFAVHSLPLVYGLARHSGDRAVGSLGGGPRSEISRGGGPAMRCGGRSFGTTPHLRRGAWPRSTGNICCWVLYFFERLISGSRFRRGRRNRCRAAGHHGRRLDGRCLRRDRIVDRSSGGTLQNRLPLFVETFQRQRVEL